MKNINKNNGFKVYRKKVDKKKISVIIKIKLSSSVVNISCYHTTGLEFDSKLGNVHSSFHHFDVNKINTKLACALNTGGGFVLG